MLTVCFFCGCRSYVTTLFLLIGDGNKMKISDGRILFQLEMWAKKVSILGLLAKAIMVY